MGTHTQHLRCKRAGVGSVLISRLRVAGVDLDQKPHASKTREHAPLCVTKRPNNTAARKNEIGIERERKVV